MKLIKRFNAALILLLRVTTICLVGGFSPLKAQTDVNFFLKNHLLAGKKILKAERDYHDAYVWVLAANNEVYRIHSETKEIVDYSAFFSAYNNLSFIDIAGKKQGHCICCLQK